MNKVYLVIETILDGSSKVISAWKDDFDAMIAMKELEDNGNPHAFYEVKEMEVN